MERSDFQTKHVFISIRHTARSSQNTGIQRVVRGFTRYAMEDKRVRLVEWRNWRKAFYEPVPLVSQGIANFGGPVGANTPLFLPMPSSGNEIKVWLSRGGMRRFTPLDLHPLYRAREGWLFLPELMTAEMMREAIRYGKSMGLKIAVLLYDCIAYFHPEWANDRIRENHRGYLHAAADSDLVISISETTALDYRRFLGQEKRTGASVIPIILAEEFLGIPRNEPVKVEMGSKKKWKMLYVSTLDPRKNHLSLLNAIKMLSQERTDLDWEFTLVGHRYEGAEAIAEKVEESAKLDSRIIWKEGLDDATLAKLYADCDFTVFPSLVEGFGLPIAESLWRGRPSLCSGVGSMREISEKGGCLEVDPTSEVSLKEGMIRMMTDGMLWEKLFNELKNRKFKTWKTYSEEILRVLS